MISFMARTCFATALSAIGDGGLAAGPLDWNGRLTRTVEEGAVPSSLWWWVPGLWRLEPS